MEDNVVRQGHLLAVHSSACHLAQHMDIIKIHNSLLYRLFISQTQAVELPISHNNRSKGLVD